MCDQGNSIAASAKQLEVATGDCKEELRALLDAIPDLVWLKSPEGVYINCNRSVERLLGASKIDILGKTDYDFLDKNLAEFVREQDKRVCAAGKSLSNEEWLTLGDGRRRLYETTKAPMYDAEGKLIGILGISRDITERTERNKADGLLRQSEAGIKRILDNAADAILIADRQGRYQYVNEQAEQLLGHTRDELLGMSVGDLSSSEEQAEVQLLFQKLGSTGSLRCELRLQQKSGGSIPVDFNGTILPDGRAYCSFRDIRARQQADAEHEQHRETLVREVHHRIKNNLQGVVGLLQRELGRFQELDPLLEAAISQVNAIAIVHGLQASCSDEAIPLCAGISDICRTVSELAQRPVFLQFEDEKNMFRMLRINRDDAISVALVINELILNAVKHSPPGGGTPLVLLQTAGISVKLNIRNALEGVPDFNFDTGEKLGTGLSLVRSLLPKQGAHLDYAYDPEAGLILTTLQLTAPVVMGMDRKL